MTEISIEDLEEQKDIETEADIRKKDHQAFLEECAKRLTLPMASDESDILTAIERQILDVEEANRQLEKRLKAEQKEHDLEVRTLLDRIDKLTLKVTAQLKENEALSEALLEIRDEVLSLRDKKQDISFLEKIKHIFTKGTHGKKA